MLSLKRIFLCMILMVNSMLFAIDIPSNKIVDTNWLKKNIMDPNIVIVDLRTDKRAYRKEHIPNAVHWSSAEFRENRVGLPGYMASPAAFEKLLQKSGINENSVVVFYTEGVEIVDYITATVSVHMSEYYGLTNTAILNGGYAAWVKDGGMISSERVKPEKSNFKIKKTNTDYVATIYDIDNAILTGEWILLDARPDAYFIGETAHPKAAQAGHIDGAKQLFVGNFTELRNGIYYLTTNKEKVLDLISKSGGSIYRPIIWYCNAGWLATGGWFMSKFVGQLPIVKMYDGSMVEYGVMPDRKVLQGR